jgi:hypothetical protein
VVLELAGGKEREALCEQAGEHRLVWSLVNWRPDGSGVVLKVNRDGHRRRGTLAYVDLTAAAPRLELLLPDGVERFGLSSQREWLDNDRFYYVSDETGFSNLYEYDLVRRTSRPVTAVEEQAAFSQVEVDGRKLILVRYSSPRGTTLAVLDPATGQELGRRSSWTAAATSRRGRRSSRCPPSRASRTPAPSRRSGPSSASPTTTTTSTSRAGSTTATRRASAPRR